MNKKILIIAALLICASATTTVNAAARSLTVGLSGSDVTMLQQQLIAKGYLSATATGYFGPATLAAVKKFQCDQNIVCSGGSFGVAGPQTQAALGIAGSSSGSASGSSSMLKQTTITGGSLTGPYSGPLEFSGWIPYWREATGTADVLPHLNQLASVMPFTYTMTSDGHVNDAAGMAAEPWTSFIAAAKAKKVRVIPTIMWGNGDAIHNVLSDATARVALEDEIANLVKTQGFDGIDIDFEAKKAETKDYFSTFLKGLYSRMGDKWVYCTIESRSPVTDRYSDGATIPADAYQVANDYVEMNKYCDRVEIMAYDQGTISIPLNKGQTSPYAPVSDPKWVTRLVQLASQTIAKKKIIIGVPTYGYEYTVTPLVDSGYQYKVLWPFNPTYGVNLGAKLGISPVRSNAEEPSFSYVSSGNYSPTGDQTDINPTNTFGIPAVSYTDGTSTVSTQPPFNYVTWSDAQAVADKVALARKLGVRGVAVFKFDGGEDPNTWSVLK